MRNLASFLVLLLLILLASSPAAAVVVWDESIDGDLSTDPANPTSIAFGGGGGNMTIIGTVQASGDTWDYITFSVSGGQQLAALLLERYVDLPGGGPGDRGFHAINEGSTSFIPSGATSGSFLGGAHLDPAPAGTDLLPVLAAAPQAGTGFSTPLGIGRYSYLVQQTDPELTGYTLTFQIVPEPTTGLLLSAGLLALGWRRSR